MEYTLEEQLEWLERHNHPMIEAIKGSLHELRVIQDIDNTLKTMPPLNPHRIAEFICHDYGIELADLTSPSKKDKVGKKKGIIEARQLTVYLLERHTQLDQEEIASIVGRHRTIIPYSRKKIRGFMESYPWFREKVLRLTAALYKYSLVERRGEVVGIDQIELRRAQ